MAATPTFRGFSKETIHFFRSLKKNNDKLWFDAHKDDYEKYVQEPSREFVIAMGEKLSKIAPDIVADPRVNKSLFRIYRDTRFSNDKTPYKTHMGIWMWEGDLKRMENSGFYFQLDPPKIGLGAGQYMFPKDQLPVYRDSVVHPKHGPALVRAIAQVEKNGYDIGGLHYKKTPRGYDPEHKNAELLLYNGLYTWVEEKVPEEFFSPKLIDYLFAHYKKMLPLHKWLKAMTERM